MEIIWVTAWHLSYHNIYIYIFFSTLYKKNIKPHKKEEKIEFNKLSNSLNIKLIGFKKNIQYMIDYIYKGKNLKTKPIDLSNKSKCIAYGNELWYGLLHSFSYMDLGKMKVISFVVEKVNTTFRNQIKKMINALMLLGMSLLIGFLKFLRENKKVHSVDDVLEEELVKYL